MYPRKQPKEPEEHPLVEFLAEAWLDPTAKAIAALPEVDHDPYEAVQVQLNARALEAGRITRDRPEWADLARAAQGFCASWARALRGETRV